MSRILLAASRDWAGTARLPLTLSSAGIVVHCIAPPGTAVLYSSCLEDAISVEGTPRDIAEKTLEHASAYDRVIICDDPLLEALLGMDDPRADAVLPGPRESISVLNDKTRFPQAATEAGLPVPRWLVADNLGEVRRRYRELGGVVLVKGTNAGTGAAVRVATSAGGATTAALELGFPVVIEERVAGELALMPCLYEHGDLIGAFAAHKRRTLEARGPSSSVVPWVVDQQLAEVARLTGEQFGLHGFASLDLFRDPHTGGVTVIDVSARPVPMLHAGRRVGVDMAALLFEVLEGRVPKTPRLSRAGHTVPMFPQELQRLQARWGTLVGTARWLVTPRALAEVPWRDAGLLAHYLNNGFSQIET